MLVTGFDIIFFWVARMIMMGLKFTGEVPFREVYVHGLIRDHDGQKMSKSKGNVIDPLDIVDGISLPDLLAKRTSGLMQPQMKPAIEKATRKQFPQGIAAYGTDALAPVHCAARHAKPRSALRHDARRGVSQLLQQAVERRALRADERRGSGHERRRGRSSAWPIAGSARGSQAMLARVESGFAEYRLDIVANALYEFTWHEFCDWYLELSKAVLQSDTAAHRSEARHAPYADQYSRSAAARAAPACTVHQ